MQNTTLILSFVELALVGGLAVATFLSAAFMIGRKADSLGGVSLPVRFGLAFGGLHVAAAAAPAVISTLRTKWDEMDLGQGILIATGLVLLGLIAAVAIQVLSLSLGRRGTVAGGDKSDSGDRSGKVSGIDPAWAIPGYAILLSLALRPAFISLLSALVPYPTRATFEIMGGQ